MLIKHPLLLKLTHHFYFFDIWALWRSGLSARAPECPNVKNLEMVRGLDQHGAKRFCRLILPQSEKVWD